MAPFPRLCAVLLPRQAASWGWAQPRSAAMGWLPCQQAAGGPGRCPGDLGAAKHAEQGARCIPAGQVQHVILCAYRAVWPRTHSHAQTSPPTTLTAPHHSALLLTAPHRTAIHAGPTRPWCFSKRKWSCASCRLGGAQQAERVTWACHASGARAARGLRWQLVTGRRRAQGRAGPAAASGGWSLGHPLVLGLQAGAARRCWHEARLGGTRGRPAVWQQNGPA